MRTSQIFSALVAVLLALILVVVRADDEDELFEPDVEVPDLLSVDQLIAIQSEERRASLASRWNEMVIPLSPSDYELYTTSKPRMYDLYIFIQKQGCESCDTALESLRETAKSYFDRTSQRRKTLESIVFFISVDESLLKQNQRGKEGAPALLFLPRTTFEDDGVKPRTFEDIESYTSSDYATLIRTHSKVEVPNPVSASQEDQLAKVLWLMTAAVLLQHGYKNRDFFRSSRPWIYASVFVYGIATSGFLFCVIRGSPPFYLDGRGNIGFIHPQRNNQFIFEGLFVAGLNIGVSLCVYGLMMYVPYIKDKEEKSSMAKTLCGVLALLYFNIVLLYRHKAPWYLRFG